MMHGPTNIKLRNVVFIAVDRKRQLWMEFEIVRELEKGFDFAELVKRGIVNLPWHTF